MPRMGERRKSRSRRRGRPRLTTGRATGTARRPRGSVERQDEPSSGRASRVTSEASESAPTSPSWRSARRSGGRRLELAERATGGRPDKVSHGREAHRTIERAASPATTRSRRESRPRQRSCRPPLTVRLAQSVQPELERAATTNTPRHLVLTHRRRPTSSASSSSANLVDPTSLDTGGGSWTRGRLSMSLEKVQGALGAGRAGSAAVGQQVRPRPPRLFLLAPLLGPPSHAPAPRDASTTRR